MRGDCRNEGEMGRERSQGQAEWAVGVDVECHLELGMCLGGLGYERSWSWKAIYVHLSQTSIRGVILLDRNPSPRLPSVLQTLLGWGVDSGCKQT